MLSKPFLANCRFFNLFRRNMNSEHFQKYCSHSVDRPEQRFFWVLASFSLSYRALAAMLLRSSLAKTQNSSLPNGSSIFSNALLETTYSYKAALRQQGQ
jgi:hypothetical protein